MSQEDKVIKIDNNEELIYANLCGVISTEDEFQISFVQRTLNLDNQEVIMQVAKIVVNPAVAEDLMVRLKNHIDQNKKGSANAEAAISE